MNNPAKKLKGKVRKSKEPVLNRKLYQILETEVKFSNLSDMGIDLYPWRT
jgi:hypothetical protein